MKKGKWYLLMAWRDSRRNRGRLLLFVLSIIIGIGALVATLSFGRNLSADINAQAKLLLGADLVVRSGRPVPEIGRASCRERVCMLV